MYSSTKPHDFELWSLTLLRPTLANSGAETDIALLPQTPG